ncbi:TPA: hypothetical protein N0F65_000219 [Lagenidium giganteum]|uniref:DUF7869 domain-containing protein n=1 Tax=Lagenidium giganteum TaxID=4803 RepID=A0AAV2YA15_9STRA|nr:TPA: hypothetical protein N0F65_000219 [Lagenidium giganteum]
MGKTSTIVHCRSEGSRRRIRASFPVFIPANLRRSCPQIQIRSPRSNVCDVCTIFHLQSIRSGVTADKSEAQAKHVADSAARTLRLDNACKNAGATRGVTTMDSAQNVALPHLAETPSKWTVGKGSNEVVSMMDKYPRDANIYDDTRSGGKCWEVFADNCAGQNKNNTVIMFLLFLTHAKHLNEAKLLFFVTGHTKNNCDRGFGNIKRRYARRDIWSLRELAKVVQDSVTSNYCILLESSPVFRTFNDTLKMLYKDLKG